MDGDGAADLLLNVRDVASRSADLGNFGLFLGGGRPAGVQGAADAAVVFGGVSLNFAFRRCAFVPDLDGGGMLDILCSANYNRTYIHLVEDIDLDGDLSSVNDCDADDNDPLVQ